VPSLDPSRVADPSSNSEILDAFLEFLIESGIEPYDHQEEAILELYEGKNVILNTPTGSGKSLVALALHFRAICQKRRSYYTVPIKALANEKFLSLCESFGPENVGMITGDATVNAQAPVICCTAEILSNLALREGSRAQVDEVIMDEFHYYSDLERGVAWQVPLLTMSQARFLLMSATLGDTSFFEKELTELTGAETVLVKSEIRPVPLDFEYSLTPLEEKVEELVDAGRAPIYLVHFTQLACARTAQNLMSRNFCSKEEKAGIAEVLEGADFRSPYGKEMKKLLRHGLGIHHAGLLPKYRVLVEKLAQRGLMKVICGTDTLGVGVNVPIRTVLFTQLYKFGGQSTKILAVRDFRQICGRAGRKGFDDVGYVVAQAPEYVIDNKRAGEKAAAKGKKSKGAKKKPPERGFVNWDEKTFQKLQVAPPEKLISSFNVRHGTLLNVLSRSEEDGCAELRRMITASHETATKKKSLRRRAFALFKGLVEGKVLTIIPKEERSGSAKVKLNVELQDDFTMNQALGLYLLETIPQLEQEGSEFTLNVLSLVEAILEDPTVVLRKQTDKVKTALVTQMKADGVEYDDRMEALDEVEHPKPGKDFIYDTYNQFVLLNPWAKEAGVRPKSVAREMFENWLSFEDYVKIYGLERSEAVLLRHLSEVYKVLAQTVPPALKTEEIEEAEAFFGEMLRGVDSSLIDEWEKLKDPEGEVTKKVAEPKRVVPFTRKKLEFERAVRRTVFDFVKLLSREDCEGALSIVEGEWTIPQLKARLTDYHEEHGMIRLDPEARSTKFFRKEGDKVEQMLVDDQELNDWQVVLEVDFAKSDEEERVVLDLVELGPLV
jgi:superfamily II RNA helicase